MNFPLSRIAAALACAAPLPDAQITGWSFDTRTIAEGDLFIALPGEKVDGHDFIAQAFEKGAAAALASRDLPGRILRVADPQIALEDLARQARQWWGGVVIGVTGSAGKTTTKDVCAAILGVELSVGRTVGNFNNQIGVPISILRLPADVKYAVLEIGMNHAGEIRHLSTIARPDIAVVTNVGTAHIENFTSIEGIAAAKRELVEALPATGLAVLNGDDARVRAFAHVHAGRSVTYGLGEHSDLHPSRLEFAADRTRFTVDHTDFETRLIGRHGVMSILAGLALAREFGIPFERTREAVRELAPPKMRGERLEVRGMRVLNDCYNSNPDAARAMLDVLRDLPAERRIAVLGEMLELGQWAEPLHREVGQYAVASGISVLVGIRGAARCLVESAVSAGLDAGAALFFEEPTQAGDYVRTIARPGDALLFKGSRGTRVELALARFLD